MEIVIFPKKIWERGKAEIVENVENVHNSKEKNKRKKKEQKNFIKYGILKTEIVYGKNKDIHKFWKKNFSMNLWILWIAIFEADFRRFLPHLPHP